MRRGLVVVALVAGFVAFFGLAAEAHGFTSVVYADVRSPHSNDVRVRLGLEYDLLVVSAASAEHDDGLFEVGQPAWDRGDDQAMAEAMHQHEAAIIRYVGQRFTVQTAAGHLCTPSLEGDITVDLNQNQDVPYASAYFDFSCPDMGKTKHGHVIRSRLFPDSERFIKQTKTVLTYEVDGKSGSAALDDAHSTFSTEQSWYQRFWEFFRLGANHLLTGIDHILFLVALIAGSRRLRESCLPRRPSRWPTPSRSSWQLLVWSALRGVLSNRRSRCPSRLLPVSI